MFPVRKSTEDRSHLLMYTEYFSFDQIKQVMSPILLFEISLMGQGLLFEADYVCE